MAMLHVAMFDAVDAIDRRFVPHLDSPAVAEEGASPEAAAAAAAHAVLTRIFPAQRATFDAALARSVEETRPGASREASVRLGASVGERVAASRAGDGAERPDTWRAPVRPGVYVPTALPVGKAWGKVVPWAMTSATQFRPGPPPRIGGPRWAKDREEVEALGGRQSTRRTPEQTEAARFWTLSGPSMWLPLVHRIASLPDRSLVQNARLYALVSMATADAYIAVFDAKYAYGFWRPMTAIRHGTGGGEPGSTEATWEPLVETPMHPEYPCAHCATSGAALAVMEADPGASELTDIAVASRGTPAVTRHWARLRDWQEEISNARIWGGIHYRKSTEVGTSMGRGIGEWTVGRCLRPLE
jgi:hypothetical protein